MVFDEHVDEGINDWALHIVSRHAGELTLFYERMIGWPLKVDAVVAAKSYDDPKRLLRNCLSLLKGFGEVFTEKSERDFLETAVENRSASLDEYRKKCLFRPEVVDAIRKSEHLVYERFSELFESGKPMLREPAEMS